MHAFKRARLTIRLVERGHSSVGRAIALQAIGRRFDPVCLHQLIRFTFFPFEGMFDIVKKRFTRFVVYHVCENGLLL